MPDFKQVLYAIEIHNCEGIRKYFKDGGDPNEVHDGVPLFQTMIEMYTRSPRFKECVKIFVDSGLKFSDRLLLSVLLDDAEGLSKQLQESALYKSYVCLGIKNTYTPLTGGSLLHICAEFNSIACAGILIQNGADINAKAGLDEDGFGGHTPIFHTVNQNNNNSRQVMDLLLKHDADLTYTVKGLIWGKGYGWETWIPSVNPISYAMFGLLPQMHRDEMTITETVSLLMKKAYDIDYIPQNIPCAYLNK